MDKRLTTKELTARGPYTVLCEDSVTWLLDPEKFKVAYISSNGLFSPDGMCLTHKGALYLVD